MLNQKNIIKFILSEKNKRNIEYWCLSNNIEQDKIKLYYNFVLSLYKRVNDTYFGPEFINTPIEIENHFNWCWFKTLKTYKRKNIIINEYGSHYEYLKEFFLSGYYYIYLDDGEPKLIKYIHSILNLKHKKNTFDLNILSEIYNLMDNNFKK